MKKLYPYLLILRLIDDNTELVNEMDPRVRELVLAWMDDCFSKDLYFRISETYRSAERQLELYRQGRVTKGQIVTWTLHSDHETGNAMDIYPIGCTHEELAEVGIRYGIEHPYPQADPPHYYVPVTSKNDRGGFTDSISSLSPTERIKVLGRVIIRATGTTKSILVNTLTALKRRMGL